MGATPGVATPAMCRCATGRWPAAAPDRANRGPREGGPVRSARMRAMSRTPPTLPATTAPAPLPVWWLAVLAPTLLAYNVSPSATWLNQLVAAGGWGLLLANLVPAPGWAGAARAVAWPLSALAGLAVAVLGSR